MTCVIIYSYMAGCFFFYLNRNKEAVAVIRITYAPVMTWSNVIKTDHEPFTEHNLWFWVPYLFREEDDFVLLTA